MSKKIKLIAFTGVIILSTTVLTNYKANATIGTRIRNFFSSAGRSCVRCLGRSSGDMHPAVGNLKATKNETNKLNKLANKGKLVGVSPDDFDLGKIKEEVLYSDIWYHQNDENGKIVTLTSIGKPNVLSVEGKEVSVMHVDTEAEIKITKTTGVPRWYEGPEIVDAKMKQIKNKVNKYLDSMEGIEVEKPSPKEVEESGKP